MDLYSEFAWRGLVYDKTDGVRDALKAGQVTGYVGFDPTAASLHVGNLLVIMALARMQRAGHRAIALVGGGTGLIGDPKPTTERALLSPEQVDANVTGIRAQLSRFLDFDDATATARLVNNAEWLTRLGAIQFMRDVGKHFTLNAMLAKDAVRRRIDGEGISYTEFSYALLQAYDFLELYRRFGCSLQMGGSDQWGNITAGMDLIRRTEGAKVHALVMPLITTASGAKFGKTEAGAIWLDARLTSPYRFFQFWLTTADSDAVRYLKYFTFLDQTEIDELAQAQASAPEKRDAQRRLAQEVTAIVHGAAAAGRAERASQVLFGGDLAGMSADEVLTVFDDVPSSTLAEERIAAGVAVVELLAVSGLTASKGEAARLIKAGGVYVNNRRVSDERALLTHSDAIDGRLFVLRRGARQNHVVRVTLGDERGDGTAHHRE